MQKEVLSIPNTLALAATYYKHKTSVGFQTLAVHCHSVANLSQKIATRLFAEVKQETFSGDTQSNIEAVVHAGLLHAAINVGACSFEDIAENTTVQIADMVANMSRDYRLIETKRDIEFRGRISQSSIATQIVAMADIICTAKEVMDTIKKNGLAAIKRPRKILIRLDADLLALHAATRYYVLRMYAHAAKNLITDTSQMIKDKKKEIRQEKVSKAHMEAVKKNIAARKIAAPIDEVPKKGRRKKNG